MSVRNNEYDVTNRIRTTDPTEVNAEVRRIFHSLYPAESASPIDQAFHDVTALYEGRFPGFRGCDTPYHDIQHVMDVTLAMARLIDGYERASSAADRFGASLFRLGIITALFHDSGYLLEIDDRQHKNGAEVTSTHVARGARLLEQYLAGVGMGETGNIAAQLIQFTNFESPTRNIDVPSQHHSVLGNLLGSADIIAQMADRCYLEKCRDRLYGELAAAGMTRSRLPSGEEIVMFASGADLVLRTPQFYERVAVRLEKELGGVRRYAEHHFDGSDIYLLALTKNIEFAKDLGKAGDTSKLRRIPPLTLPGQQNNSSR